MSKKLTYSEKVNLEHELLKIKVMKNELKTREAELKVSEIRNQRRDLTIKRREKIDEIKINNEDILKTSLNLPKNNEDVKKAKKNIDKFINNN